jgi:FixJ family two-component response regulator
VTVHTSSAGKVEQSVPSSSVHNVLVRIRRAAQLIAKGTLSSTQSRQFAIEIEHMVDALMESKHAPPVRCDSRLKRLSARERQVLSALAAGR